MRIVGPQAFTVGASTPVIDPASAGGNPSVACQIQNSSPYQLLINAGNGILSLQPFTAQTIEIANQPLTIDPESGTGTGTCTITLAFLLATAQGDGEQLPDGTWIEDPPMTDGPLTAAAITAAITGALSTQGVVDLAGSNAALGFTGGVPVTIVGAFAALHAYSAFIVSIDGPAGSAGAEITAQVVSLHPPLGQAIAWPAQTLPLNLDPLSGGSGTSCVFLIPVAIAVGDLVNVIVQSNVTLPNTNIAQAYGVSASPATQITGPTGLALSTYQVGGAKRASVILASAGTASILGAPPAGFQYRLQRLTSSNGAVNSALFGVTSGAVYGSAGPAPAAASDNLDGLLASEALEVVTGGGVTAYLFYDLIPVQTLQ